MKGSRIYLIFQDLVVPLRPCEWGMLQGMPVQRVKRQKQLLSAVSQLDLLPGFPPLTLLPLHFPFPVLQGPRERLGGGAVDEARLRAAREHQRGNTQQGP